MPRRSTSLLVLFGASLAVFAVAGCEAEPPSRWESADQATREDAATPAEGEAAPVNAQALPKDGADVVAGGEFNKLFPPVESPWDIVFKQEKQGMAQASLQRDETEVATLSISDTASNPAAAEKYKSSTEQIDGYPMAASGSLGTAILVDDRFQVQIRSAAEGGLSAEERAEWISKFDLTGLEALR
ncbi:MAG: hypothetical protein WBC44_21900 [Planctomycetaceae bacterium]